MSILEPKLWDKKDVILKNKAEKLLKTKDRPPKTNPNKPKNKAEKLLKTRTSVKNKPKTNPKRTGNQPKNELRTG
jgi:hypothetical protein